MTATASPSTDILKSLGITDVNPGGFGGEWIGSGPDLEVTSPADGSHIPTVKQVTEDEYDQIVDRAHRQLNWKPLAGHQRERR